MAETVVPRRRMPLAWEHPAFRRLTGAWVLTNLADSALFLMVAVWVKELSGSDAAAVMVFAMMSLPAFLAPILGHLADRFSRKWLLVGCNLGIAAVIATLFFASSTSWLWLIYVVIFAYGTVGYLTGAAQSGLLKDLLPDEHLASGNGMLSTIDQTLRIIAPVLGTGLYALFGPHVVIAVTIGCFASAAAVMVGMRVVESPQESATPGRYFKEVMAGFHHLASTPMLGRLTVAIAVAFAATGLVNVAAFPVIERGLALDAAAIGPLVTVQGIGAVVAGAISARAIGRFGETRVFGAGLLLLGLGVIPLLSGVLPAVIAGLAAVGAGVTWAVVAYVTLRQRLTPARLQGRTAAAANVSINLPQTVVMFVGAALIALVDYRVLIAVTAIAVLAAALLTPRSRTKGLVSVGAAEDARE
jgi:MFS family permease